MSPMFLVAEEIKAGRLVAILEEFLRDEHAINAIYPHRQQCRPRSAASSIC